MMANDLKINEIITTITTATMTTAAATG